MVEVFKTNVDECEQAERLLRQLRRSFPGSCINFDMDDCDKILRVESTDIIPEKIIQILNANGYYCEVLI